MYLSECRIVAFTGDLESVGLQCEIRVGTDRRIISPPRHGVTVVLKSYTCPTMEREATRYAFIIKHWFKEDVLDNIEELFQECTNMTF